MNVERLFVLLIAAALVLAYVQWSERPIVHPPGVLVAQAPEQRLIQAQPLDYEGYSLLPRAHFGLTARVLSRRNYRFDAGADLAPVDLALGWGPMSDQAVLDAIDVRQAARWYLLRWKSAPPLPEAEIMLHSGNMHLIPATDGVRRQLGKVREGQVLELEGLLVDASRADGYRWTTSLSREDVGDGSCELFYLQRLRVVD